MPKIGIKRLLTFAYYNLFMSFRSSVTPQNILRFFSSSRFFSIIIILLVIQAVWFALTTRYPMAFDENYHFGVIKIYAEQWSPFINNSPLNTGEFGDLTRTSSYLFHYLLSFPYRLLTAIGIHNEATLIIILRFINIAFFTAGLFGFRRLLQRLKFGSGTTNLSLLVLVIIPVVPFLAGQINYDNMLFMLIPLVILAALNCVREIKQSDRFPATDLVILLSLGMLTSIVKYVFLPIFFAIMLYVCFVVLRSGNYNQLAIKTWKQFKSINRYLKIGLIALLIISGGLFTERYAINLVQYHSLEPDCGKLHSTEHCMNFGPWGRDHNLIATASERPFEPAPVTFPAYWIEGMVHRLFFAINYDYNNPPLLPIPITVAYILGGIGSILLLVFWRKLFAISPDRLAMALIIGIYTGSLFILNFGNYIERHAMVAINGRYLIIILPLVFALMIAAYSVLIQRISPKRSRDKYKSILLVATLIFFLQGGGALTHIAQGGDDWYWQNSTAINTGRTVRNIVKPFIIGA